MAASNGFATSTIAQSKINFNSTTLISSSPVRFSHRIQRTGVNRLSLCLNPRCEVVLDSSVRRNEIKLKESSLSALELLKTSAGDRYTKEMSSIMVIGLNIHTAPVEIREKLSIPEAQWPQAIGELCSLNHIEEAAVLSTCNRMEIYVVALSQHRGVKEVTGWMSKISGIPISEIIQHRFLLYNKDATRHLFEVSAGLDSLVLGEGQILAQVKQVVKTGQGLPGFGRKISGMFKHAITAGKRVRTETNIASGSVSVSSAAVELALTKIPDSNFASIRVLVVGAGKMGKLVIKHLASKGCPKITVINRSKDRVDGIIEEIKNVEIVYRPLDELLSCTGESDLIFTSTATEVPLFFKENIESLPGKKLFVDIAVPRNVGPCVSNLENVCVYNVDDLEEVVSANKEDRLQKSIEAKGIIDVEVAQFEAWKDSLETVPTIKKLRAYVDKIRVDEVDKCLSKMGDGISKKQKQAIHDLSTGIVNKILHGPMQHLRCDGSDDRTLSEILENMRALNRIFGLDTEISVLEQKIRAKLEQTQK